MNFNSFRRKSLENTDRGRRTYRGPIRNAPYKKHFGKIGDFDGGSYKKHFQNWQFDASLLENVRKKIFQNSPIRGNEFFLECYFWLIFRVLWNKGT